MLSLRSLLLSPQNTLVGRLDCPTRLHSLSDSATEVLVWWCWRYLGWSSLEQPVTKVAHVREHRFCRMWYCVDNLLFDSGEGGLIGPDVGHCVESGS